MSGTLIIHIGPPKTASTSLQHYWQNFTHSNFKYLGTNQPRSNGSFAEILYNYCRSNSTNQKKELVLQEQIRDYLEKYNYVVISEEMFLMEESGSSAKKKLDHLFQITKVFNPIISFCIRDVKDVVFSYYTEIYSLLPGSVQNNFTSFALSRYSHCFRYRKLHQQLLNLGFDRINFFHFSDLILGQLTLNEVLGLNENAFEFKVKLQKSNATSEKNKDRIVRKRSRLRKFVDWAIEKAPPQLRGFGLGKKMLTMSSNGIETKIDPEDVPEQMIEEYKNDLIYFKSLP